MKFNSFCPPAVGDGFPVPPPLHFPPTCVIMLIHRQVEDISRESAGAHAPALFFVPDIYVARKKTPPLSGRPVSDIRCTLHPSEHGVGHQQRFLIGCPLYGLGKFPYPVISLCAGQSAL